MLRAEQPLLRARNSDKYCSESVSAHANALRITNANGKLRRLTATQRETHRLSLGGPSGAKNRRTVRCGHETWTSRWSEIYATYSMRRLRKQQSQTGARWLQRTWNRRAQRTDA